MNVPDERVKTITAVYHDSSWRGRDFIESWILQEIAYGIVAKLKEFHKVQLTELSDGTVRGECSLQVIVPPRVSSHSAVSDGPPSE